MSFESKVVPSGRVLSIDALRGFDMFWIMTWAAFFKNVFRSFDTPFFNFLYGQLQHSKWNGFTFYDLIFPLFFFIIGLSMPFSFSKRIQKGATHKELYLHIVKRSAVLFFLGLIYSGFLDFDFSDFRYTGVLQRISICYFFSSVILINTNVRTQAIITGLILIFYWLIMTLIPVPGFGAGVLTPEGNLSAYIDLHFLPGRFVGYGIGDNLGILSTLPSIASVMMGLLTGHLLRSSHTANKKLLYMLGAGVGCLVAALIWDLVFPINKLIWTSSYVLYSAGWSLLLLCLFYWIIDVKGYKKWAFPFVIIGLNPITIYVAQRLFDFGMISDIFIHGFVDYLGSFKPVFESLCVLIVQWLFLYFLYKKRIFLKA